MSDIIDRIDDAITPKCGQCGETLAPDGPSVDFCNETCQRLWQAKLGGRPPVVTEGVAGVLGGISLGDIQAHAVEFNSAMARAFGAVNLTSMTSEQVSAMFGVPVELLDPGQGVIGGSSD